MEQDLYELLRKSTVRVSIPDKAGHGTGFFVAPGLVLTCAHVVKAAQSNTSSVEVYWNSQTHTAHVTTCQSNPDLAVLHVDLTDHPCALLDEEAPRSRDPLQSYGYPDNYPEGDTLTAQYEGLTQDKLPLLKFKEGQVRPGLSGGPLLNERTGKVCGIIQRSRDRESNLGGRAIPVATVFKVLPELVAQQQQFHLQDRHWTECLPKQSASIRKDKSRQRMLERVRSFWITGLLEQSLHGAALITLGLHEQPEMVANPWHLVMQESDQPAHPLPPGTPITQVYDKASKELLILGAPGSGKTTLLLELTRDLLDYAEQDETLPMPVVFNLSSWAVKRHPITDWLVEELTVKYQVPQKIGKSWVENDQVMPLLDGLDEVVPMRRAACVDAINDYRQEHGLVSLVVCSRSDEYLELSTRMLLQSAVAVQPLTKGQIDDYLSSAGEQLAAVRVALRNDPILQELATTPLMLTVLTLAYQGKSVEDLLTDNSAETRQRQVFTTYVERMLSRRSITRRVSREHLLQWLSFVAARMRQQQQTVLYLEHIQPNWLVSQPQRLLYRLSVGLFAGLSLGLIVGLIAGLLGGTLNTMLGVGLLGGLFGGLLFGLLAGLLFGLSQIRPRERLTRSWRITKQSLIIGPLGGLLAALLLGLPIGIFGGLSLVIVVMFLGLLFGLIAGLASGFSANQLDDRTRLYPNQGVWRSAENGLIVGLIVWMLVGLIVALIVAQVDTRLAARLSAGLGWGLLVGVPAGLVSGLGAFFQHFALRFWLWCRGSLPWNLIAFLDEAADRLLLHKVGGGYIFVHRLLLDYFAALETRFVPVKEAGGKQDTLPSHNTSSALVEPIGADGDLDVPTAPLTPALASVLTESPLLLPCGHEQRTNARFCSLCGAPVPS
jgi:eukaryotic-like serine/threonine-protein kinase